MFHSIIKDEISKIELVIIGLKTVFNLLHIWNLTSGYGPKYFY